MLDLFVWLFPCLFWFMFKQGLAVSSRLAWKPWSSGLVCHQVRHDSIFPLTVSFPLSPYHILWAHGLWLILRSGLSCLSCHCQCETCPDWADLILQWKGHRRKLRSRFQVIFFKEDCLCWNFQESIFNSIYFYSSLSCCDSLSEHLLFRAFLLQTILPQNIHRFIRNYKLTLKKL